VIGPTKIVMDPMRVLAAGEAATGFALTLLPRLVVQPLFGADATGAGLAMSRICGMALMGLGIACWPVAGSSGGAGRRARTAMLVYSALAGTFARKRTLAGIEEKMDDALPSGSAAVIAILRARRGQCRRQGARKRHSDVHRSDRQSLGEGSEGGAGESIGRARRLSLRVRNLAQAARNGSGLTTSRDRGVST
jgi:hypothetical protein